MLDGVPARCPHCGEVIEISVDSSGGAAQTYIEDCAVCCRPFTVRVRFDAEGDPEVTLDPE